MNLEDFCRNDGTTFPVRLYKSIETVFSTDSRWIFSWENNEDLELYEELCPPEKEDGFVRIMKLWKNCNLSFEKCKDINSNNTSTLIERCPRCLAFGWKVKPNPECETCSGKGMVQRGVCIKILDQLFPLGPLMPLFLEREDVLFSYPFKKITRDITGNKESHVMISFIHKPTRMKGLLVGINSLDNKHWKHFKRFDIKKEDVVISSVSHYGFEDVDQFLEI